MQRRVCDPARGFDRCRRSPEVKQRERTKLGRELVTQLRRFGVAVRQLTAVRTIDRPRRHTDGVRRTHAVPPEPTGGGESRVESASRVPNHLTRDEAIRLPPQPYLHQIAEEPTVRDDAVVAG